jgi:hypothetical protein
MRARSGARRPAAALVATSATLLILSLGSSNASAAVKPPDGFFGVSPAVVLGPDEMATIAGAGITTLRYPFYWPILQPEARGKRPISQALAFDRFDPLFVETSRLGIKVLPFVYGTPRFLTNDYATPPIGSAKLRREWTLLLQALDERYGAGGSFWTEHPELDPAPVQAWQIWNEPSSATYWKPSRTSPQGYAKLLEISDRALRGKGKDPRIVAAGLFGSPAEGIDMPRFLQRFYAVKGVQQHFDVLSLHPYAPGFKGMKTQLQIGRQIMRDEGDGEKPLWVTEIGWPTDGNPNNPFYTTLEQQATLLRRTFTLLVEMRKPWHIGRAVWYTWRDNNVNPECDLCRYAGLFDADLNPKPSWNEFVKIAGGGR